jgi:hypothetical protein
MLLAWLNIENPWNSPELLQYKSRFKLSALTDSRPFLSLGLVEGIDCGTGLDNSRRRIERR